MMEMLIPAVGFQKVSQAVELFIQVDYVHMSVSISTRELKAHRTSCLS